MNKQVYVLEMNGFSEDEAQEFLTEAFAFMEFGTEQGMVTSHLNEKGIKDLKIHAFKEEEE